MYQWTGELPSDVTRAFFHTSMDLELICMAIS